jgi:drug/metabolite transporter (DMT)-like permease
VDPLALACVLVSACMHATWNILIKTAGDPLRTASVGMVAAFAVLLPGAVAGWLLVGRPSIPPPALAIGLVSGLVEVAYFVFLSAAYRRGDLSIVSPLARGSAPLLIVVIGVVVLGERLSVGAAAGVALLLVGLLTVQRPWRLLRGAHAAHRGAAGFALLTGLMIATYTSLDRVGSQLVAPWLYAAVLWAVGAAGLGLIDLARPRIAGGAYAQGAASLELGRAVIGGLLTLGAYLLILFALSRTEVAIVGPLRESSVLITSAYGIIRLHEAVTRREVSLRLAGSVLVLLGAMVLAITGREVAPTAHPREIVSGRPSARSSAGRLAAPEVDLGETGGPQQLRDLARVEGVVGEEPVEDRHPGVAPDPVAERPLDLGREHGRRPPDEARVHHAPRRVEGGHELVRRARLVEVVLPALEGRRVDHV